MVVSGNGHKATCVADVDCAEIIRAQGKNGNERGKAIPGLPPFLSISCAP
jgi:hypothetical protein